MKKSLIYFNPFTLQREPIQLNNIIAFLGHILLFYSINILLYYFIKHFIDLGILGIEGYKNQHETSSFQPTLFIITVFLVPIAEEIIFRLGIIFSPMKSSFFIIGVYTSIPYLFIKNIIKSNETILVIYISSVVFLFLISYYYFSKYKAIELWWNKNIRLLILLSIISFAAIHVNNYKISNLHIAILCSPFYLVPYIFSGYYFTIIRIRHGILWAIFTHITTNCISTLYFS